MIKHSQKEMLDHDIKPNSYGLTNPSYFTNEDGSRDEDEFSVESNFNNFFRKIGPKLASTIPNSQQHFSSFLKEKNKQSIFLEPISYEETRKIVLTLKNVTAGWDQINKTILLNILDVIIIPLTRLLNFSFTQVVFPSDLKIAKTKPLYKTEKKLQAHITAAYYFKKC